MVETHTLAVIVDNEPGVLARVIGLFSGRGYNIEWLTVSETQHEKHVSRITIVTSGTPVVIEQIKNQLGRMVPVHSVADLTVQGNSIARELAMVKVAGTGEKRVEALRLADAFRARVIDAGTQSFIFEITGKSDKVEQFISLMVPLGLVEVARTGVAGITRGAGGHEGLELRTLRALPCPQHSPCAGLDRGHLFSTARKTGSPGQARRRWQRGVMRRSEAQARLRPRSRGVATGTRDGRAAGLGLAKTDSRCQSAAGTSENTYLAQDRKKVKRQESVTPPLVLSRPRERRA